MAEDQAGSAWAPSRHEVFAAMWGGAPAERLDHWLEVASQVPAFVGVAIGRSIWEDVVRDYEASDRGDSAEGGARSAIAERYLGFVAHWAPS